MKKNPLLLAITALLVGTSLPAAAQDCPDLEAYYPADVNDWVALIPRLDALLDRCLDSPAYFALLGAAQLNTFDVSAALESLERALLLDPTHGAALTDYAQALYSAGQLFPALEINTALLQRSDLPPDLTAMLQERQQLWQSATRTQGFGLELSAGYDTNLNGAPARSDFTLTLSGEEITLTLDPEFRRASGPYLNARLAGFHQTRTPERTHDWLYALRTRVSENSASDLLQFDWRYALALPIRRQHWQLTAGTSHLLYGGSPLFSVTEARARYTASGGDTCKPLYELAAQHQYYHGQNFMAGLESNLTAGLECRLGEGNQLFGVQAGVLNNHSLKNSRPGGDRHGWNLRMVWLLELEAGSLNAQFSYARLNDDEGYSELLQNGASRDVHSRLFRLQYARPLQPALTLLVNLNHQSQGSNIAPFENRGSALDIGLRLDF